MTIIYQKCSLDNCDNEKYAKEMCRLHYERARKWGDPYVVKTSHFNRKVNGIPRSKHPLYHTWFQMIQRCEHPGDKLYNYYGGRGIKVCSRWRESFEKFVSDMGDKPTPQHSIDRINNNGNYEPSNCRWATKSQQAINRRTKDNRSGYVGVVPRRVTRYYSYFTRNGKYYHVGMFDTPKQAFKAREEAIKKWEQQNE